MKKEENCASCPEGTVLRDGKCVLPEVTFSTFIMSLSTTALYHLGEVADPQSGEKRQDLMLAQHSIDILDMLAEKTRGNLTPDEKSMLDSILVDLKMRFVKAKEGA